MNVKKNNLIIVGSGPAGLTAAIYAARANLKPLIIEGTSPGGQLMSTTFVENWPGSYRILGPDLMQQMREHAQKFDVTFINGAVDLVDFSKRPFAVHTTTGKELQSDAIIIATGAQPKKLNVPGEKEYWGKGVTTCAVCDGAFYPDKEVIIVGGGDTAMEDATFMTKFTQKITIIQITDSLTASYAMQQHVINNPSISIIYSSSIEEIMGDGSHITQIRIKNLKTGVPTTLKADVVFTAIGLTPNTKPFVGQIDIDKNGYIKDFGNTTTSVEGVFVAGDAADFRYRQAITSAGSGCMAALEAERYLTVLSQKTGR